MPKLVITEEMLDAIEAVKGKRDSRMWDPNCKDIWRIKKI